MKEIIGIDIGTISCGFAVVNDQGEHLISGVWKFDKKYSLGARLTFLSHRVQWLLRRFPHAIAGIEAPWSGYPKATIALGKAYGVVHAGLCLDMSIYEIQPKEAKRALAVSGKADKEEMRQAAKLQFDLEDSTKDADIADALGVALATRLKYLEEQLGH